MTLLLRPKLWWEGAERNCMRAAASWDASLERQGGGEDSAFSNLMFLFLSEEDPYVQRIQSL